jgi:hypothetical protein
MVHSLFKDEINKINHLEEVDKSLYTSFTFQIVDSCILRRHFDEMLDLPCCSPLKLIETSKISLDFRGLFSTTECLLPMRQTSYAFNPHRQTLTASYVSAKSKFTHQNIPERFRIFAYMII